MQRLPMFKLVLVGESGVGKTSLFMRVKENVFSTEVTLGIDSCSRIVDVDGVKVKFSIWDTAGVERFRTLTQNYYRNCQCVLLTCSLNDKSTLESLHRWNQDAESYCKDGLKVVVANKNDLDHVISLEQLQNFSSTFNCRMISSVSAKTGNGIDEMLAGIGRQLLKSQPVRPTDSVIGSHGDDDDRTSVTLKQGAQKQRQQPEEQQQLCCNVL